jgi:hypothetical protein
MSRRLLQYACAWLAAGSTACAPALMKLPTGPGVPVPDFDGVQGTTETCRSTMTITVEIGAAGSIEGRGLRGRFLAGLAEPASARLEAIAPFGQPLFIFVARDGQATLLLPRDGRVLQNGSPDAVLEALTAVPLDPRALRESLLGCASFPERVAAQAMGDDWRLVADAGGDAYFHRDSGAASWHLVAFIHREPGRPAWRAEYQDFQAGPSRNLPRMVRLKSIDSNKFDLRLTLSQVEVNTRLGPEVFQVQIPAGTRPITLDELRGEAPLDGKSRGK